MMDDLEGLSIASDKNLEDKLQKLQQKVKQEKNSIFKKGKIKEKHDKPVPVNIHQNRDAALSKRFNGPLKVKQEKENLLENGNVVGGSLIGKRRKDKVPPNDQPIQKKPRTYVKPEPNQDNVKQEKTDWKQVKMENKALREQRKKSKGVELYALSKEVKIMWEELRQDSCEKAIRKKLSNQVYQKIKPFIKKIVNAHDMVRVLECLLAKGDPAIRNSIFEELKDDMLLLSKHKYAHFFVLKMLRYGSKDHRQFIVKSFEGHVVQLLKNPFSMAVVELAYNDYANALERSRLTQELYGPEFKFFKDDTCKSLSELLEKNPAKSDVILKNMKENLLKILPKGPWKMTMMHTLMYEYLSHCDAESRNEFIDLIKNDVVNILHTREGARVGMICIWHGTAKDRKHIIKSFKTFIGKICKDEHGHMVLYALFDSVDDTTLVSKAIISELLENIGSSPKEEEVGDLFLHKHARKVILYLIAHRNPAFFHPGIIEILRKGDDNVNSKKDPDLRKKELFNFTMEKLIQKLHENVDVYFKDRGCLLALLNILNSPTDEDMSLVFKNLSELLCQENVDPVNLIVCLKNLIENEDVRKVKFSPFLVAILQQKSDLLESWLKEERLCNIFVTMISRTEVSEQLAELLKPYTKILKKNKTQGGTKLRKSLSGSN